jgi:hypothetical protein
MSDTAVAAPVASTPFVPEGFKLTKNGKKVKPIELPAPLVRVKLNKPKTWIMKLLNTVQGLVLVVLAAYLGMLMAAALYYLIFQTYDPITAAWHFVVFSDYWRHLIRDGGEGFLGGLFGFFVGWNYYKPRKAQPNWLDKILIKRGFATMYDEDPLSGRQLRKAYTWFVPAGLPGALIGVGLVAAFHYKVVTAQALVDTVGFSLPSNASVPGAMVAFAFTGLPVKLVGFLAANFYGRRVMRGVFDDLQVWLVELLIEFGKIGTGITENKTFQNIRQVSDKTIIRLILPPGFQARYTAIAADSTLGNQKPSFKMKATLYIMGAAYVFLIGFGAWVIFWKARGH